MLAEEGYRYSSSVFPVRHDLYGDPDAPRRPHRPRPDGVLEIPMTTVRAFGRSLPCAGGGWFRLLPYAADRAAGCAASTPPKAGPASSTSIPGRSIPASRARGAGRLSRFRHYIGLESMEARLVRLLRDFRLGPHGRGIRRAHIAAACISRRA